MLFESFKQWDERRTRELNEFFGIGAFFKSLFSRLAEPVKKDIEIMSKNIDSKTGEVLNAKELRNKLLMTIKNIANDKIADLKGVEDEKVMKEIVSEFITEIRAVFVASRIPVRSIFESADDNENLYEAVMTKDMLQKRFTNLLLDDKSFEKTLSLFVNNWLKFEKDTVKGDVKKLNTECVSFINNIVKAFKDKISGYSEVKLKALIKLTKKGTPKKEEVERVISDVE